MKLLTPNQMAGLLPVTIFIHQLEEFFGQFPQWYSNLLNAQLSTQDFILINGIGLIVFTVSALFYILTKNNVLLAILGTFVFVNGVIHLLLSIFTLSYSPGTISGVILFVPLGIIIYKKIFPGLQEKERIIAIVTGTVILFTVSMIAVNI